MASLPYILDLAGTFVFAISGAMAGVRHQLDVFGVLVLSFAAANAGGLTRDVLIGAIPPLMSAFPSRRQTNSWLSLKQLFWAVLGRAGGAAVVTTVDQTLMRGSEPHDR